jgi:hypothetical protein
MRVDDCPQHPVVQVDIAHRGDQFVPIHLESHRRGEKVGAGVKPANFRNARAVVFVPLDREQANALIWEGGPQVANDSLLILP